MRRCFGALIMLTLLGAAAHAVSKQDIADCRGGPDAKISSEVETIEACTRALKATKLPKEDRARMHFDRAQAYMRVGRYPEAVADLDKAIDIDPGHDLRSMFLAERAFNLYMSEDYDGAIAAYDQALSESPADAHLFHFRGLAFLKKETRGVASRISTRSSP